MKRFLTIFFLLITSPLTVWAQRETDNWYFGQNASLEFNAAGTPVSFLNSAMNAPSGSASISDKAGNLLFYTDGETVWNRLHQVMANGTGLEGQSAAKQSAIIIPKPGNNSHYYIFTKQHSVSLVTNRYNLQYSEVNMLANNGMGEVINATKNTPLLGTNPYIYDKITAVHHANHQDFWVITIRETPNNQQEFAALKITAAGIDPTPILSRYIKPVAISLDRSDMKASPTGKHLAVAYSHAGWLLDFNDKTGQITNPMVLFSGTTIHSQNNGVEFSPDGSKVYFGGGYNIEQFDISLSTPAAIIASKTTISPTLTHGSSLQLARNGKIYCTTGNIITGSNSLMEIANPNAAGMSCNFRQGPTLATGTSTRRGLPNFIQSYFAPPRFNYAGICAGSPVAFNIPNLANIDSVKWNFGDPGSISNTSTALQPSHVFSQPGVFPVQLTIFQQGFQSVFERQVTIQNKPLVQLPKDTSVCEGTAVHIMNAYPTNPFNERFLWSTGNRDSAILRITSPGIYWLELTNGDCTTRDSIIVQYRPKPKVELGPDRLQCGNAPLILNAGNPGAAYLWQPNGETTQTISVTKPGVYSVTVTSNRCSTTDAVNVSINGIAGFEFGEDMTVCEGEPVTLKALPPTPGALYTWSDSSRGPFLEVKKSGKYWARVFYNGCTFTDTVNVTFKACPPPIIPYIPNIISPNNDNRNDKFEVGKIPLNAWALKIYNRWGQLIYTSNAYSNNWPETEALTGTYYYLLEEPETGRKFKGWVEVVK